ncbi:MAG: hydrolase 2, exosortase A system-associated [Pseudomonadota bacterium]
MNAPLLTTPRVEPFFFDAEPGTRFSLYHAPNPQVAPRGAILYVHPFAEELTRTRRMAALQSRAFAELGFAVLQIDLFGCGDSCGEFSAGRWDIWREDLVLAANWLAERDSGPLTLWGLRLGGLLALDVAARLQPRRLLLWQPYLSGRACINQFLRLSAQLKDPAPGAPRSTSALRAQLAVHGAIEVAGFEVAVPLVKAIDACDAARLTLPPCDVHWLAYAGPAPARAAAGAARLKERWAADGAQLHYYQLDGAPEWSGAGHLDCPELRAATATLFAGEPL